jgi:hypothetical protein
MKGFNSSLITGEPAITSFNNLTRRSAVAIGRGLLIVGVLLAVGSAQQRSRPGNVAPEGKLGILRELDSSMESLSEMTGLALSTS